MRSYFFGDIHGNETALEAVLAHLHQQKADEVYCLGDIVGWLPTGKATLERMRDLGFPTVAGNHDLMVTGMFPDHPNQVDRMQATAYNAGTLSTIPDAVEYLSTLPLLIRTDEFVVVHHSPFHLPQPGEAPSIENFNYLDESTLQECLSSWGDSHRRLIFSGHDHVPVLYELRTSEQDPLGPKIITYSPAARTSLKVRLNPGSRYWVKAGSVGGPYRDGVPSANSVLYDSSEETITLFRIPFQAGDLLMTLKKARIFSTIPTIRKYVELLERQAEIIGPQGR